jgi:hypothetical protein
MLRGIRKTYKGYYWNRTKSFDYIPPKDIRRPVIKYDLQGNILERFESAATAQREIGYPNGRCIKSACRGTIITAYGFVWRYEGDDFKKFDKIIEFQNNMYSYGKPVDMYTLDGKFKKTFLSMAEAAKEINSDKANISACCLGKVRTVKNYIFRYHSDPFDKFSCDYKTKKRPICIYDLQGNLLQEFKSKNEASKNLPINYHKIEDYCDGLDNHIFDNKILMYKDDDVNEILKCI